MISAIPDGLREAVIALLGAAALKGYEYLLGRKKQERDEDRDLRKELRDEIMYLHSRIETLEADLHATKTKYWEDVELIYQLKTNNITLRSKLQEIKNFVANNPCTNECVLKDDSLTTKMKTVLISSEHNISAKILTEDSKSPEDSNV